MACRLSSTKPLSEPMMEYFQFILSEVADKQRRLVDFDVTFIGTTVSHARRE